MGQFELQLNWITDQYRSMVAELKKWAEINSGTDNAAGLSLMLHTLQTAFSPLQGTIEVIPLPPRIRINSKGLPIQIPTGSALRITKHPKVPRRVLLGGHMDTVFAANAPFQTCELLDANTLRGPGVTDMKGGLLVMLTALLALERSPSAGKIGWEVLINADEEVGSPSSAPLFIEAAKRNSIGLLYEPAFPDGSVVGARKGSINLTAIVKGRAAHAGRDFHAGRNAISALSRFIISIENFVQKNGDATLNVGHIEGGGPTNIVPDLALCRLNLRSNDSNEMLELIEGLHNIVEGFNKQEGISLLLHEDAFRKPKPFDEKNRHLFESIKTCASDLGITLHQKPSGGVCDGNILSEAGLPTIDTLGVIGGNIHTHEEYVLLNSLTERAALSAYFLMNYAEQKDIAL